jgi:hypothetical protein
LHVWIIQVRFEWRKRFAQGSPRFLSRSRMRSRSGLASPVENQACGIAKYPRLRAHRHEARMTPAKRRSVDHLKSRVDYTTTCFSLCRIEESQTRSTPPTRSQKSSQRGRPATSVCTLYSVLPAVMYRVFISGPPKALFVMKSSGIGMNLSSLPWGEIT